MLSLYINPPKAPIPRVGRNLELKLTSHLSDSTCRFIRLTPAVSPASTLLLTTMRELLAVKVATVARALQDISIGSRWGGRCDVMYLVDLVVVVGETQAFTARLGISVVLASPRRSRFS